MFFYILLIWNVITFLTFGCDKMLAKLKRRRIPEKVLLLSAAIFGSYGAALGMLIFNHKTSKPKFRYPVPLLTVAQSAILFFLYSLWLNF